MGEHRPFGRSGGPAGILQHGDRIGRDAGLVVAAVIGEQIPLGDDLFGDNRRSWIGELRALQKLEANRFQGREQGGEARDHGLVEDPPPQHRLHLLEGHRKIERHHDLGAAIANLSLDFIGTVERVEIDDGAAGFQHAIVENHEGRRVGQQKADFDAFADANRPQPLGRAVGKVADFGKAQPLSHEIGARPRAVSLNRLVEQAVDERRPEPRVPIHALRVGIEPGPFGVRRRARRHPQG